MSLYCCERNLNHRQTDQKHFIDCIECYIENLSQNQTAFFGRHGYEPGVPTNPGLTYWSGDIASGNIGISNTIIKVTDFSEFLGSIFDPHSGSLYWNTGHQKVNWYVPQYRYGVSGSGTILPSGGLNYPVSGILVADVFGATHSYPVKAVDPMASGMATKDLVKYPYICAKCGSMAHQGENLCLACNQRAKGHTCHRCSIP